MSNVIAEARSACPEERGEPGNQTPPLSQVPIVESTLGESTIVSTEPPPELEEQPLPGEAPISPSQKRVFVPNWSTIIACVLFVILLVEHSIPLLLPVIDTYLHPKAVVTLFAAKQQVQFTYSFLAVTGTADQSQNQISSRLLTATTSPTSVTILTTGIGYTPAIQAKGTITFYNEAPYSQTIQLGTVLTGSNGAQVITDETASIPAGNGGTNGSATVPAHAIVGGTVGNIQQLDVNTLCCLSGILAKNTAAFTGGEDPQAYPTVSVADVQKAAHQVAATLDPVARNGVQSQIKKTERSLIPLQCSYTATSIPNVGERATEARVSVSETCKTQVYDAASLQDQISLLFVQDAEKHAGNHFLLNGIPTVAVAAPTLLDTSHHTYKLAVTASGTLVFHLSDMQLHTLVTQIAGKPITQAQRILLQLQGVQGVSITPARQGENSLPQDPNNIEIIIS
jgi:hypothetical protein